MPGFFGDQAERLLRKSWNDPDELAQELFAMFQADLPMTTDQPIIQRRNNDSVPAYTIIDNTDGSRSPIVINKTDNKPSTNPNTDSGGNYNCCGSSGQNSPPSEPGDLPFPPPPVAPPVTSAPPPGGGGDPNLPHKTFLGSVTFVVHQGDPDVFGWDGEEETFVATGCFPYKPPTVPAPTNPFDSRFNEPKTLQQQIDEFMARWNLDGYTITGQSVGPPGGVCAV
jgi:hypothetical protein